jgi:hypothetical protein
MLSPLAVQVSRPAELEMFPNLRSHYPQNCWCTSCGLFTNFKSILLTYSKPLYLSLLAFILLLLENFLFGIALSFGGGFWRCLIDYLVSWGGHHGVQTSLQGGEESKVLETPHTDCGLGNRYQQSMYRICKHTLWRKVRARLRTCW